MKVLRITTFKPQEKNAKKSVVHNLWNFGDLILESRNILIIETAETNGIIFNPIPVSVSSISLSRLIPMEKLK
ncbi:hypothetical protein D7D25_02735 [Proteiniphilum sp. X52]|nr:hypothetical protein D7D25_02735 [Proteiniphilum sp. X52]